jgi:hypothetical protein
LSTLGLLKTYRDLNFLNCDQFQTPAARHATAVHIVGHLLSSASVKSIDITDQTEKTSEAAKEKQEQPALRTLRTLDTKEDSSNPDNKSSADQGFSRPKVLIVCAYRYIARLYIMSILDEYSRVFAMALATNIDAEPLQQRLWLFTIYAYCLGISFFQQPCEQITLDGFQPTTDAWEGGWWPEYFSFFFCSCFCS